MGNPPKLPVYENARQGTALPFPPLHAVSCLAFFILIIIQSLFL